jgi:imidazoleglycerol-phosphate dehydratase
MNQYGATIERTTRETGIRVELGLEGPGEVKIETGLPFFDHMLRSMAFHGRFGLVIKAAGDVEVDPHHLVEDVGIVLGDALHACLEKAGSVERYGHSVIPMDDALSEVCIDVCDRPYLAYTAIFPQNRCGDFDIHLLREFLLGLANRARINLHVICRAGENSHHMAEALFKALGRALKSAYTPAASGMSTKGGL